MDELWIFAYGSLMWQPGFSCVEAVPARVHGYHRSLCIYSHIYRGTPACPGLVLGLDAGGSCRGMAFRISPECWPGTLAYLRDREQVNGVYMERKLSVVLGGDAPGSVVALAYVADRNHAQYAGHLSRVEQRRLMEQGVGQAGSCRDYVRATLEHLEAMGIRDRSLRALFSAHAWPA